MILSSDDYIDKNEMDDENCPFANDAVEEILSATFFPKPFGLDWNSEVVIDFLKKLGYKVIDNSIAVKPGEENISEENNLVEVFNREVQKIMIEWLLSKRNTKD